MSWPAVRTEPVRRSEIGAWPILTACASVVLAVPVLTFALGLVIEGTLSPNILASWGWWAAQRFAAVLVGSSFVAALALLPAIPLALRAARLGWAGWAVAVLAGLALAAVVLLALSSLAGGPPERVDSIILLSVGAVHGGAFWLGARLAAPHLFRPTVSRS